MTMGERHLHPFITPKSSESMVKVDGNEGHQIATEVLADVTEE